MLLNGPGLSLCLLRVTENSADPVLRLVIGPPEYLAGLAADLAFEITLARNLVPLRPGCRHERTTKRPGGRYKTRKPGETTRLTPLTRTVFWLMPVPALT